MHPHRPTPVSMQTVSDPERRARDALLSYVTGEGSLTVMRSGLKGVPDDAVRRVLAQSRREFERLNPDRAVLLESVALGKRA